MSAADVKTAASGLATSVDAERQVRTLVGRSFGHYATDATLKIAAPKLVRAGRAGGLPFDALTTDLVSGCLPATQICYGNCFAARAAFETGFDFGTRVRNILDEDVLRDDLAALPPAQGYVRNGWNSDPSWEWEGAAQLAEIITDCGRHAVFITKCFKAPGDSVLARLAAVRAELRISVSAFDTQAQLEQRLLVAERFREHGGVAVPNMMTARFRDPALNEKQDRLCEHLLSQDFPTAENSLRFVPGSPVLELIDLDQCGVVSGSGDFWSGRLFLHLLVPTLTSTPPEYRGLQSPYLSRNDRAFLGGLWHDPVHTHDEVMSRTPMDKPKQCGVAMSWQPQGVAPQERS